MHRKDFLGGFRRETDGSHDRLGTRTVEREFGFHALTSSIAAPSAIATAQRLLEATAAKYGELA